MSDAAGGSGGGSPGGGGIVNTGSGLDEVEDTDVSVDTFDIDQVFASVKLTSPLKSAVIAASAVCTKPINTSVCTPKS